jgi:hypothetical protein
MVFVTEVFMTQRVRMMVPLFWTTFTPFSSHPELPSLSQSTSHDKVTTDTVPYIVYVVKGVQQQVCAVHADDMTVFSVAYVSGFIAMHLLHWQL